MGAKTYNLLRNLVSPAKQSSMKFDKIQKTLQNHIKPKPLVIAERFKLRHQMKHESISDYITELCKLSENFDFKDRLSDALRDRLVCGMHCSSTQKRVLSEKDLDLEKALAIAISIEIAAKDASELQKKSTENEMHKMSINNSTDNGKSSHDANDCWFKEKTCRNCHKQAHIERVPNRKT